MDRYPIDNPFSFIDSVYIGYQVIFLFLTSQRRGEPPLFLMPPFVFISGSRGTLTATCRARCGRVFLSCVLSPFPCFSSFYIQYLEDTAAYPSSRGNDGERRVLKVFFHRGMMAVGCVWRHACHTRPLRLLWLYYFSSSLFFRDSHLLFTSVLHLQSTYISLMCFILSHLLEMYFCLVIVNESIIFCYLFF